MQITLLEYFRALAKKEHMTRTAEELNITQSTLSKAISKLEAEVGVPLFNRIKNRIVLNQAGEQFLIQTDHFFELLERGIQEGKRAAELSINTVSIGVTMPWYIASAVFSYVQRHPEISIRYELDTNNMIQQMLRTGHIRFAITNTPLPDPGFTWEKISEEAIYAVCGFPMELEELEELSLFELRERPFFMGKPRQGEWRSITEDFCRKAGFVPNVVMDNIDIPQIHTLLGPKRAVMFLPEHLAYGLFYGEILRGRSGLHVYKLRDPWCRISFGVCTVKDAEWTPEQTEFRNELCGVISQITRMNARYNRERRELTE